MAGETGLLNGWFRRAVLARLWLCFIVLGLSFFVFGACTFNLFRLFEANTALILEHGWVVLGEGAALQFAELVVTGYASMVAWVVFRACEDRLVKWLNEE